MRSRGKQVEWVRILPFIGVHLACLATFFVGWRSAAVIVAALLYFVRMFAITGFYHRYFSHRTFRTGGRPAISRMGLHRWRDNMRANATQIEALGFDRRFQRMWDYYFCYCEGGFLERAIGTAQIVFTTSDAVLTAPLMAQPVPPSPWPVAAA